MPFGSVFGAIVFGILGTWLGSRLLSAPEGPLKLKGVCLIVMGLAVAAGLLTKRSWARWTGVLAGLAFAALAADMFFAESGVFPLTVVLAAAAVAVLLVIPATGRPAEAPSPGFHRPSFASRILFTAASLGIVGFLAATGWADAVAPEAPAPPDPETRQADARPQAPSGEPEGPLAWHDFADGLKKAKEGRKLMVADFYATWCGPCKLMEKRTFRDPRVMTRLRDVVPVRVDAEESVDRGGVKGTDLALRYAIEVYPTIVVVDGDGHEVARNSGVLMPDEFLAWIDAVIERASSTIARR